jgi:hypothetical protein
VRQFPPSSRVPADLAECFHSPQWLRCFASLSMTHDRSARCFSPTSSGQAGQESLSDSKRDPALPMVPTGSGLADFASSSGQPPFIGREDRFFVAMLFRAGILCRLAGESKTTAPLIACWAAQLVTLGASENSNRSWNDSFSTVLQTALGNNWYVGLTTAPSNNRTTDPGRML